MRSFQTRALGVLTGPYSKCNNLSNSNTIGYNGWHGFHLNTIQKTRMVGLSFGPSQNRIQRESQCRGLFLNPCTTIFLKASGRNGLHCVHLNTPLIHCEVGPAPRFDLSRNGNWLLSASCWHDTFANESHWDVAKRLPYLYHSVTYMGHNGWYCFHLNTQLIDRKGSLRFCLSQKSNQLLGASASGAHWYWHEIFSDESTWSVDRPLLKV